MRRPMSGQSMVEFALVAGAFVIILFAAISAAFHSLQRAMAETAAASGVQVAASAVAGDPTQADLAGAVAPTEQLLRSVMFSTTLDGRPGQQCLPMDRIPQGTLEVCTYPAGPGLVGETVRGHPAYVVPFLAQLLPWSVDVTLVMHQVSYQQ